MGRGLREKEGQMNKREFYVSVVNGTEVTEEMRDFASSEIKKMDRANEKRKNTLSKRAKENLPLLDKIYDEILGEEPKTATDVGEELEVSVQKASHLLRAMVADGRASVTEVKIPKKGIQKGYVKNFKEA